MKHSDWPKKGIYPGIFSKEDFELQAELEHHRNPGDMFFVNAPHILIIHSLKGKGQWKVDPALAAAWFDLICASRGLGSIIMTYPVGALSKMPRFMKCSRFLKTASLTASLDLVTLKFHTPEAYREKASPR